MAWLVASYLYLAGLLPTACLLYYTLERPVPVARAVLAVILWPLFFAAICISTTTGRRA